MLGTDELQHRVELLEAMVDELFKRSERFEGLAERVSSIESSLRIRAAVDGYIAGGNPGAGDGDSDSDELPF